MTKDELLAFVRRICLNGSPYQAGLMLDQLRSILERTDEKGAKELERILKKLMYDVPEIKEISGTKEALTLEDLDIAHTRATERRRREQEAAMHSRC